MKKGELFGGWLDYELDCKEFDDTDCAICGYRDAYCCRNRDNFFLAPKEELIKRLEAGMFKDKTELIEQTLLNKYNYSYKGYNPPKKIRPNARIECNNGGCDGRGAVIYYIGYDCPTCGRSIGTTYGSPVACTRCGTFFDWSGKEPKIETRREVVW